MLRAAGWAERTLAGGLAFCKDKYLKPLQGLSAQWLEQADGGTPEFALAAALAGTGEGKEVGPLRTFLEEVGTKRAFFDWSSGSTSTVWSERPPADNLAAVFRRRQMEAFRTGQAGVPLSNPHTNRPVRPAPLEAVFDFLRGRTNDEKLHDLIWGPVALDWRSVSDVPTLPAGGRTVPFEFGVPRLLVERDEIGFDATRERWAYTRTNSDEANAKPDPTRATRSLPGSATRWRSA